MKVALITIRAVPKLAEMRIALPTCLPDSLGRRSFLAGLGALGAATLVGCNASAGGAGSEAASPSGGGTFSYTDARGKVVEFALPATTVVAQSSVAATLLDFGYQVAGAYGELKPIDGKLSYQAGDLDVSKITVLADVYGEFDVEKFAAMNPQVLIDLMFEPGKLWYLPEDLQTKVEQVSPTIGMEMLNLGLVDIIKSFEVVAGKLGADLTASLVTDAGRRSTMRPPRPGGHRRQAGPDRRRDQPGGRQGLDHQRRPGAGLGYWSHWAPRWSTTAASRPTTSPRSATSSSTSTAPTSSTTTAAAGWCRRPTTSRPGRRCRRSRPGRSWPGSPPPRTRGRRTRRSWTSS